MHWQDKSVQRNAQPGAWTYACLFIANATKPVIDKDTALLHHLLDVAQTQRIGRVPAGAHWQGVMHAGWTLETERAI